MMGLISRFSHVGSTHKHRTVNNIYVNIKSTTHPQFGALMSSYLVKISSNHVTHVSQDDVSALQ